MKRVLIVILLFVIFLQTDSFAARTIKILAIGNSFSVDASEAYLDDLAKAAGVKMIIGNCNIGGCSLKRHSDIVKGDSALYAYRKIINGDSVLLLNRTLQFCLQDENWDYVTFQQVSHFSGMFDTYFPYIEELMNYVRKNSTNPNLKFALHQTWAYASNSTHSGFKNYNRDQQQMYSAIVNTVNKVSKKTGIRIIIPCGTAIQNGRRTSIGDNFCRDGFHLSLGLGRLTAAYTWFEIFTKKSALNNPFKPENVSYSESEIAKISAHSAVKQPNKVTIIKY